MTHMTNEGKIDFDASDDEKDKTNNDKKNKTGWLMSKVNVAKNAVFGNRKHAFSICGVKPTKDYDELIVNKNGLNCLIKHFHNIVSLAGPPGTGKSTLSSALYNCMRNDNNEYFKISNSIESYTKGLWFLNEQVKVSKANKDCIDILDLEGIEAEDAIYYLVVVAMVLSKAMLLCSERRFQFSIFKIIKSGVKLFKKYNIYLPKPVLYIQVPYGMKLFNVNDNNLNESQLIKYVKTKHKFLSEFEVHLFALPQFKESRFEKNYQQCISKLVEQLKKIPENVRAKQRVIYAKQVINALNNNSPKMIIDLNYKFFNNELNLLFNREKSTAVVLIKDKAKIVVLQDKLTYDEYCKKVCPNGAYYFHKTLIVLAKVQAYYDPNFKKFADLIKQKINKQTCCIMVEKCCEKEYEHAIQRLKNTLVAKGNSLMELHVKDFDAFVNLKVSELVSNIKYKGYTKLPWNLKHDCNNKKLQLNTALLKETKNEFQIPDDHLSSNIINTAWNREVSNLKSKWNKLKTTALTNRLYVKTHGNHRCSKCGINHIPGVCHKGCPQGGDPLWIWVDGQTQYCICEKCHIQEPMTAIYCYRCGSPSSAQIIKI